MKVLTLHLLDSYWLCSADRGDLLVLAGAGTAIHTILPNGTGACAWSSCTSTRCSGWRWWYLSSEKTGRLDGGDSGDGLDSILYTTAVHVASIQIRQVPVNPGHLATPRMDRDIIVKLNIFGPDGPDCCDLFKE